MYVATLIAVISYAQRMEAEKVHPSRLQHMQYLHMQKTCGTHLNMLYNSYPYKLLLLKQSIV